MATRLVKETTKDQDGDILALCNAEESWSPRLKLDVIEDIESGLHEYYVRWWDGECTWIEVAEGARGKYLRTDKDDTDENNLLHLPNC